MKDLGKEFKGLKEDVNDIKIDVAIIKEKQEPIHDISQHISEIKSTLAENTNSLKEHMRRTEMAEVRIEKLENHHENMVDIINKSNLEIKEHLSFLKGAVKTISVVVAFIALLSRMGLF